MTGAGLVLLLVLLVLPRLQVPSSPEPVPTENAASAPNPVRKAPPRPDREELELVTLLGFDAIPAILDPEFVDADVADLKMSPDELVLGISVNGESKAYSVPMLSAHEIVNDVVGGVPLAVTW